MEAKGAPGATLYLLSVKQTPTAALLMRDHPLKVRTTNLRKDALKKNTLEFKGHCPEMFFSGHVETNCKIK